jgi:hypothetical protein
LPVFGRHFLFDHFSNEARKANVTLGCFNPNPARSIFI